MTARERVDRLGAHRGVAIPPGNYDGWTKDELVNELLLLLLSLQGIMTAPSGCVHHSSVA